MSLKRLLNPSSDGTQNQNHDENLWHDDSARVRPRIAGPDQDQWQPDPAYNYDAFSYPQDMSFGNVFDGGMVLEEQFDPGLTNPAFDPGLFDQSSFLQPPSENAAYSASFTSTPVEPMGARDVSADLSMRDVDTAGGEGDVQICYGMILREKVRLLGKAQEIQEKIATLKENGQWPRDFQIRHSSDNGELFVTFPDGTDLGHLSEKMAGALEKIIELPRFELEACTHLDVIVDAVRRAGKASDAAIRVNINVYGLDSQRDEVGKELSGKGLFLQAPDACRPGVSYDNPHILRMDGMDETDSEEEEEAAEVEVVETSPERDEDFEETIAEVFRSLRRADGLHRVEGGDNLNRALYPHQEEALDFMTQRETGDISDEYRLWKPTPFGGENMYSHIITNTQQQELPDESGGGILADEMGMGKSLTTLVLIGKTMRDARHWVDYRKRSQDAALAETPCRATLVIVPSRVLINTWVREIKSHMKNSLKVLTYHGRSRKDAIGNIERYDIVITTYNTLAKEHHAKLLGEGKSPLHDFFWYRVVLDEAHMIRRRETTFHKAVIELPAKSRWCLSGTPIQNSLADLASLLAFIKVRPFHDPGIFRHWISHPFEVKELKRRAIQRLIALLESICLRRTIGRVDLPEPLQETRLITFTPQELVKYNDTYTAMQRYVVQQANDYNERPSTFGMFQIYLQLRSFCNHGTYQPSFSWAKRNLLDEEADSVRSLTRNSLDRCLVCRQPLPVVPRDRRPRYVENCNHVLCDDCSKGSGTQGQPDGRQHCPLCESIRRSNPGDSTQDSYLLPEGYSSKMRALVTDVRKDIRTTKSIIFSCWTRTLDLIARHLKAEKIRFERIDGKTLSSQRQTILDNFDGTREVPVLIMTTGTGAFGLNLQSVNRVFIVEPQWNPSVESQAIARAIRLGQQQQVLVTRYRVENSIEEDMYLQQKHKLKISKMDFSKELPGLQEDVAVQADDEVMGDVIVEC
ncbi:SNF2 family N-terminal domain-containing protein [Aspergillus californicus]